MKLAEYLDGMRAATSAAELEAAIQAPFKHAFHGRTWSAIGKVREEAGRRICAADPLGVYIPQFGPGRRLTVCGQIYSVGRGGNSTGVRYCWHAAGVWAQDVLRAEGFSIRAAHRVWEGGWGDYPHRVLGVVAAALAGSTPDPVLGELNRHERSGCGQPIRYSIEENDADRFDRRAHRPCACGGTLFDWGGGHSEGFDFINWHCNACPDVFTEYMSRERFYALRQRPGLAD